MFIEYLAKIFMFMLIVTEDNVRTNLIDANLYRPYLKLKA